MSVQSTPRVSAHAQLRFVQRAGSVNFSPRQAWQDGIPVDVEGYDYHHAKYHESLGLIFLSREGVVTTVLKATYTDFKEVSR